MRQLGMLVGAVAVALFVGCGPVDGQISDEGAQAVEQAELLQGLADACQADNYNQCVAAGYASCNAWSANTACGDTTCDPEYGLSPCFRRDCTEGPCQNIPLGATFQSVQKFRVCFNPQGQSCTEWLVLQDFQRTKCGC
ncbi:hypothetical protein JY651_31595 [Pyxidicoccus parkwayensis]|uniref:Lipoprotein n=1 Tax=Pyxidicoccus parkwayensis TaxID=2813578 RepID=A0ABX7NLT3_9BACT|nr:hypothetical protein [Pyxidicoccus parkwaysis]QSQ19814.1 hypothetical protein JY651_31595 [Pyxidicoccus parkwaysis]